MTHRLHEPPCSILYALHAQSGLPWAYGGEYNSYARLLQRLVHAWLDVGLVPHFVFDGESDG